MIQSNHRLFHVFKKRFYFQNLKIKTIIKKNTKNLPINKIITLFLINKIII